MTTTSRAVIARGDGAPVTIEAVLVPDPGPHDAVVGVEVPSVAPGDSVIVAWRAPCGVCEPCRRGSPSMCESSLVGSKPAVLADGTIVNRMLGIGGFADRVLVAAAECV